MAAANVFVGDINQATSAYQGGSLPTPPSQQQAPPPPPPEPVEEVKPERNTTPRKLGSDDGENLKIKKKSRKQRKALARGTGQLTIARDTGVQGAQGVGSGGLSV